MTDICKSCKILEEILESCLVLPVDSIYHVRRVICVLHTLLMSVDLLTVEDERYSLRDINRGLSQLRHSKTLSISNFLRKMKSIAKAMVIMTAYIAYMLKRTGSPGLHIHLRMFDSADDTEFNIRLISFNTSNETCIRAIQRSAKCVTHIVAECAYTIKFVSVYLERDILLRISRSLGRPAFTIKKDIRIDGMKPLADLVHCLDIVDSHKVETESVDMILLHPPLERLYHIFAEHFLL